MPNLYRLFRNLLPPPPLLIGTVQSAAGGEAVVQLPDGATIKARGAAGVGETVFVRDGAIEGSATALTPIVIDV